jgi:hypothetical protein
VVGLANAVRPDREVGADTFSAESPARSDRQHPAHVDPPRCR